MSQLGLVRNAVGRGLDFYVSNYSVRELKAISNSEDRDQLPTLAIIACAPNDSIATKQNDDEGYYSICFSDANGNICPINLFDTIYDKGEGGYNIEKSGLIVEEPEDNNARLLKVKLKETGGLTIDEDGNLMIKLAPDSGLVLTKDGLMTDSAFALKASKIDV